ncbi:flagellar biosynthesis protein FlhB [Thiohalophilus sp.]|uniref:flagellar biosynthesis protein FlhB n=1 Tax=Thiohalophilus sp. TaxID=3028392 RepID=UPI002ACD46A2|nr:flagellar biosynthesis protein FlhB [Thiohalophilus sp.]MDZ7804175.1 flagellar biosynthesis protein FlhB [Thiohalophilus sp.]
MAEDTGQERTQEATPHRKQQAREKGQVASSRELNTMLVMLISGMAVLLLGPGAIDDMLELIGRHLDISRQVIFDPMAMPRQFESAMLEALWILAPFFIIVVIAAVAGPILMGSVVLSPESIAFKWEKIDPIKGLKRIFAWRGLMELVKALVKFILIASVAIAFLYVQADTYLGLGGEPVMQAIPHAGYLLIGAFLIIGSALILIAAVDVPFQIWDHHRQLKMTFQEVKDENKDTEGNPDVRGRARRMQREMAQHRMMAAVPEADVVVTNPSHFSVALKYDPKNMGAPVLVAKGADLIAMQIRTVARENNVILVQAPPLARALFHTTELEQEIPSGLYLAVAQVLAYVFQLRRDRKGYTTREHKMNDLPIPDDFKFD